MERALGEVFNLPNADGTYHHPSRLIVYAGDDDSVTDAIQITEDNGRLLLSTFPLKDVKAVGRRPRELNLILDLPEENGEDARLHVYHHKGQTLLKCETGDLEVSTDGTYFSTVFGGSCRVCGRECLKCHTADEGDLDEEAENPQNAVENINDG